MCCGCLYPSIPGGSYFHHWGMMPIPFSTSLLRALLFLLPSLVMSAFKCLLPSSILCLSIPSATRFGISRCWSLWSSACLSGTRRVQLLDSNRACGQGRHSPMVCQISMGMQAQGVSVISVAWGSRCGRSTGSTGSFGSELVASPWVRWSGSVKWSGWSRFSYWSCFRARGPSTRVAHGVLLAFIEFILLWAWVEVCVDILYRKGVCSCWLVLLPPERGMRFQGQLLRSTSRDILAGPHAYLRDPGRARRPCPIRFEGGWERLRATTESRVADSNTWDGLQKCGELYSTFARIQDWFQIQVCIPLS